MAKERIQKILARAGIASRRKAEQLIVLGEVTVNGKPAKLGDQAEYGRDAIKVSGKLIHSTEALAYLAFHKPKGVISMFGDPQGRPSLTDYLGQVKYRLFPVGRLDFNSEGLILLTNDGAIAEKLQKREDILRVYHVKLSSKPAPEAIERLSRGGRVGGRGFQPRSVRLVQEFTKKALVEVTVSEHGPVDLKAYFEMKGVRIERIIRVALGHLRLSGIEPGKYKYLKASQVQALIEQPELGLRRQEFEEQKTEPRIIQAQEEPKPAPKIRPLREPRPARESRPARETRSAREPRPERESRPPRGSRPARGPRPNRDPRRGKSLR